MVFGQQQEPYWAVGLACEEAGFPCRDTWALSGPVFLQTILRGS